MFIGTLVYLTIMLGINERMERDLKDERLHSERLLSEKLLEQKKRAALQTDFSELEKKHAITDHQLINTEALLHQQKRENRNHRREMEKMQAAASVNFAARRRAWTKDSMRYVAGIDALQRQISDAQKVLAESDLEREKYIEALGHANELRPYGTSVESRKKKGRLTVKAARTRTIKFGVEVSDQLSDDLSVSIISPSGNPLPVDPSKITVRYDAIGVSSDSNIAEKRKLVTISFTPSQRLIAGAYKVSVLHQDELVTKFITILD
jgi:hypothetical protein